MVEIVPSSQDAATTVENPFDLFEGEAAAGSEPASSQPASSEVKISKKQKERESKKLKNKTKQAITVMCKAEDAPYETLFCQEPTT